MVRLVLVSHSLPLAEALVDFVRQMAGPDVQIDIAAGTGNGDSFGTDPTAIVDAINKDSFESGVVVIADVGSAVMSAEMALEMIGGEASETVVLADAPLVEGTLSAAVQAGLGADLETVVREAETAGGPKRPDASRDVEPSPADRIGDTGPDDEPQASVTAVLPNPHGLHARPAARFVRTAGEFDASITVVNRTNGRGPVSARSISSVTGLGAIQGHEVEVVARGTDAHAAVQRLQAMLTEGFGEIDDGDEKQPSGSSPPADEASTESDGADDRTAGIPIAPGTAVGPAFLFERSLPDLPTEPAGDPETEWTAVAEAVAAVQSELEAQRSAAVDRGADEVADIFDALSLLLQDEELLGAVRNRVQDGAVAARAWLDAIENVAREYESLEDTYLAARGEDVRDVGRQVIREMLGTSGSWMSAPDEPFVLVADHLAPSEVTALPDHALGVFCTGGNPTSHSAILLRSRRLPTVFQASVDISPLSSGQRVALDGSTGEVWLQVSDSLADTLKDRREEEQRRTEKRREAAQEPAQTRDGVRIRVDANVNQPADASLAADNGADGVGLLRTEFLFPANDEPPSEDDQVEHLRSVLKALSGRPVSVRVLDVGGDKPLPYVSLPDEQNPFLGIRGIRLLLRQPDLFRTQLRSILRAGANRPIRIMLPMVVSADEVRQTRTALTEARASLEAEGQALPSSTELGIMIETPASALGASHLAEVADFFSIGTNDLTQYTVAVDREHADLSGFTDALTPSVLCLIRSTVQAAGEHGIPVSCCGEAAADPEAIPVLLGLGLRSLSVSPPAIPDTKALIRTLDLAACRDLARQALTSDTAREVRERSRELGEPS